MCVKKNGWIKDTSSLTDNAKLISSNKNNFLPLYGAVKYVRNAGKCLQYSAAQESFAQYLSLSKSLIKQKLL
jgi:hypothetical protein